MKEFSNLILNLERCSSSTEESLVLSEYFSNPSLSQSDLAWTIYLLLNGANKALVKGNQLRAYAQELSGLKDWLFEECLSEVGDLSETLALILPEFSLPRQENQDLSYWMNKLYLQPEFAGGQQPNAKQSSFVGTSARQEFELAWKCMNETERTTFNKILTGTLRNRVKPVQIVEVLSDLNKLDRYVIASRLNKVWFPSQEFLSSLIDPNITDVEAMKPYPFTKHGEMEASAKETSPASSPSSIGSDSCFRRIKLSDWIVEWNWSGLAAQLIKRKGQVSIWTADGELITDSFPELLDDAKKLPDGTVLIGKILGFKYADVLPHHMLVQRMSKKLNRQVLSDVPVVFMAHDLIEENSINKTSLSLEERKERLAYVLSTRSLTSALEFEQLSLFAPCRLQLSTKLRISPVLQAERFEDLERLYEVAEKMNVLGLILKRKDSMYSNQFEADNEQFDLQNCTTEQIDSDENKIKQLHSLSWNLPSKKMNAVLISAQAAGAKRRGFFTDYTFGLWKANELLPVARVASNLDQDDLLIVDKFVRENTLVKFGPVATVKAKLVFELECDAVVRSSRHKSGLTLLHPRILSLRRDLAPGQASSLDDISKFL